MREIVSKECKYLSSKVPFATQSVPLLLTRMTPWYVVQQFCHLASDLVSISLCCATFLPPCQRSLLQSWCGATSMQCAYYAIVLQWCRPIGRYDRPLIHVNPTTTMGRACDGEITPVHPFNHPSLLISSSYNPWSISSEINLKTVKSTPWTRLCRNLCVLYFFCSLICASFVSRLVFIPSCIRNKLYISLLWGSMFNISTLHTAVRSYSICCMLKPLSYILCIISHNTPTTSACFRKSHAVRVFAMCILAASPTTTTFWAGW